MEQPVGAIAIKRNTNAGTRCNYQVGQKTTLLSPLAPHLDQCKHNHNQHQATHQRTTKTTTTQGGDLHDGATPRHRVRGKSN